MPSTQPTLNRTDNAALFISGGEEEWLPAVIEQINRERVLFEPIRSTTYSELFIDETPTHTSVAITIDFETRLPYEERAWVGKSLNYFGVSREYSKEIQQKTMIIFRKAREQIFEDGMESDFSRELVSLVENYGDAAVNAVSDLIFSEAVDAEVASEALRWLGHLEHTKTYHNRLLLLEQSLSCSSARVRDGAALGLASLDDSHAIPSLRKAIRRESYPELREDMEQVLKQLESSQ